MSAGRAAPRAVQWARTGNAAARTRFRSAGRRSACRARSSNSCRQLMSFVRRAAQRDRIDGGEPANRPAQVDIGSEHRPARSPEVNRDRTGTDRGRDRPAQRGQQDVLDRQPKPAPRVVDLACLRDSQRRRQSRQVGNPRRFRDFRTGHAQVWLRSRSPARNRGFRPPRDAWQARRNAATTHPTVC